MIVLREFFNKLLVRGYDDVPLSEGAGVTTRTILGGKRIASGVESGDKISRTRLGLVACGPSIVNDCPCVGDRHHCSTGYIKGHVTTFVLAGVGQVDRERH